jgi:tetratricopeptide (TPR) repeat protein
MSEHEVEREIREIKREIIESRGLVIKTNNLTSTLGSDLKSIAKRQAGYERKLFINSAVAYVITIGVVFVGAYVAADQRARGFEADLQALEQQKRQLQNELAEKQKAKSAREQALQNADRLADLIGQGEREKVLGEVSKVDRGELSPLEIRFLEETADRFRSELSMQAFEEGLEHERQNRLPESVTAFERSIELAKGGPHVARVRLHLAKSLSARGMQDESIEVLHAILDSELVDRELVAEARWNLALAYAAGHKRDEARRELLYVINKFPTSQWARLARPKLMDVNRLP